jgi:VanZ family protein
LGVDEAAAPNCCQNASRKDSIEAGLDTDAMRLRKLWLAIGYAMIAAILWASFTPEPPQIDIEQADKFGHMFSYAVLMYWFCQLYAATRMRLAHAVAFVAMGVAIEFAQQETGYRTFEYFDMLADAIGVALGWAVAQASRINLPALIESRFPPARE